MQSQDELDRLTVARSLKIDNYSEMQDNQDRLDKLVNWTKAKGATDSVSMLASLADLKNRLGNPTIHELNAYAYLELERMAVEGNKTALELQKASLEAKQKALDDQMKQFEAKNRRNEKGQFV